MPERAWVGLGSNVGDRLATLRSATAALSRLTHTELVRASRLYETTAVGPSEEPFLNAVIELRTGLDPRRLLEAMLTIERDHGRVRRTRWGARTLDLDLLVWVDADGRLLELDEPGLVLPHARMLERDFVLAPLCDVAPELVIAGATIETHLQAVPAEARTIRAISPAACYLAGPQADSSAG